MLKHPHGCSSSCLSKTGTFNDLTDNRHVSVGAVIADNSAFCSSSRIKKDNSADLFLLICTLPPSPLPAFVPYEPIVFISNPDLIIRKHNILPPCYWLTQSAKTDQFFRTRIWKQINAAAVITSAPVCHYTLHLAERQRGATEDEEVEEVQEEEVRERFQISTFIPAQDNFRSIKTLIRRHWANKRDTSGEVVGRGRVVG